MQRPQSPTQLERPAKRARTEEPSDETTPKATVENGITAQRDIEEDDEGDVVAEDTEGTSNEVAKGSDLYLDTVCQY